MAQRYIVTSVKNLPPGSMKAFSVATRRIVLCNVAGRYYALDDRCTHEGAPLSEGMLDGTIIVCPWHNAEFDVTCGKVLCMPAVEDVKSYPVFVNDDSIEIEI